MSVSARVKRGMEQGSWIRRMFEEGIAMKQRYGEENVFDLSLGNPVMEPPAEFSRELRQLVENPRPGMHGYMENAGYRETRAAVAAQLAQETGINLSLADIVMTCGAAAAINVVMKALLNEGDEVILFSPWFVDYHNYVENHGGVAKVTPTDEQFMPRLEALEAGIGPRTRAVLINSPNNPTGVVYGESLLRQMGELLRAKEAQYGTEIFIVSDEPYRRIIYDGLQYPSPLNHHRHTVIVTSHSKDLSVACERIGYIALHPDGDNHDELMAGFIFCNRTLGFINAPALMQNVVRHLQQVTVPVAEYQRQRDFMYGHLVEMGYSVVKPQGAFYLFPRCPIEDDIAFVRELQNEQKVLTVPGITFGTPGYFRIAYCVKDRVLEGSLPGLEKMAKKYNQT
jgi:aspartate aminotransferase